MKDETEYGENWERISTDNTYVVISNERNECMLPLMVAKDVTTSSAKSVRIPDIGLITCHGGPLQIDKEFNWPLQCSTHRRMPELQVVWFETSNKTCHAFAT